MLSLDSPRWSAFKTYFGSASEIPERISRWQQSIGSNTEGDEWRELADFVLHQGTIVEAAIVIVPHIVPHIHRIPARGRLDYIIRIGMIHSAWHGSRRPQAVEEFVQDYERAIRDLQPLALACLTEQWDRVEFRFLVAACCSLCGHTGLGDVLFSLDGIGCVCPKCGDSLWPKEIHESGYC
jgi:hypothetical protein